MCFSMTTDDGCKQEKMTMRRILTALILFVFIQLMPASSCGDETKDNPIFPVGARLELLFTRQAQLNSGLTEGPAVAPDGSIYFTDMPFGEQHNGMILRFDPGTRKTTVFTDNSGKSNGLAFNPEGYLISCDGAQGGGRRLIKWDVRTGQGVTLAARYMEKRFNAPNDLSIDEHGRIYFTDPRYIGLEPREIEHMAVYRVNRDGSVIEITHDVEKPNGITLSPDGRTLYVGDHNNEVNKQNRDPNGPPSPKGAMKVYAFDLNEDGLVSGPRRTLVDFGTENGCDGITVDSDGNIYLTCRRLAWPGLMVVDPSGRELAFLPTGPINQSGGFEEWRGVPSNVEFGIGGEKNILYVTIDKSLYRIRVKTEGIQLAQKRTP
jgi:gluconolactonase